LGNSEGISYKDLAERVGLSAHVLCSALRAPAPTNFAPSEFVEPTPLRDSGFPPGRSNSQQKTATTAVSH
jgi:hypothetical protein